MYQITTATPALPAETQQDLQAWANAASRAMSPSTIKAWENDSRAFADWQAKQAARNVVFASVAETVAAFLQAESADGKAVATVRRLAATISRLYRQRGLPDPCKLELVRLALKEIARTRGTDQKQAAGLTERDTLTIRARMGDSVKDARDLALVLAGRDLLGRASELVSLTVADITATDDGALVKVRRTKTSTDSVTYYMGKDAAQAVADWLARASITQGPVFQSLTKGGRATGRAIDTRDVRRILKAVAVTARLQHGASISGHSLRVGMAQDLVAANVDVASVMQAGGWATSRMVARYTQHLSASRGAVARFYNR